MAGVLFRRLGFQGHLEKMDDFIVVGFAEAAPDLQVSRSGHEPQPLRFARRFEQLQRHLRWDDGVLLAMDEKNRPGDETAPDPGRTDHARS